MKLITRIICVLCAVFVFTVGAACGQDSTSSAGESSISTAGDSGKGNNGGNGGSNGGGNSCNNQTETVKISASLLEGKVANLMGAEGIGIEEKAETEIGGSATSLKAVTAKNNVTYSVRAYSEEGMEIDAQQKKSELVKDTEDGVCDICFYEIEGEEKSYKTLNNQFTEHHHDGFKCEVENCDKISDEIKEEENSDAVDTVISLEARVNKLYTIGNFTFMSVSSAVKGNYHALVIDLRYYEADYVMFEYSTFGTPIKTERLDNVQIGNGKYSGNLFGYIAGLPNHGMIPIKISQDEKEYHTSNYWSDDYNQSYIIDNATGVTYSLSEFPRIYSVSDGIIKVYNKEAAGSFDYYKPVVTTEGISFKKYVMPEDTEIIQNINGKRVCADIYGNLIFVSDAFGDESVMDEFGEIKISENMIFAQNVKSVYDDLYNKGKRTAADNYRISQRYHKGSDGRIYRFNFNGDMINLSVNVLDENCEWQAVEKNVDVYFNFGLYNGFISYGIINAANAYFHRITCIKQGYAYYSNAACYDSSGVYTRAVYYKDEYANTYFIGAFKISVDGNDIGVENFINNVRATCNKPQDNLYSVILVGNTQMLYFGNDAIYLWDVTTGDYKKLDFALTNYYCAGGDVHNNLYVEGLGYLSLENEINLDSFGEESFSETPVYRESQLDEYYKLITAK